MYLWDLDEATPEGEGAAGGAGVGGSPAGSFAGCFLILKRVGGAGEEVPEGSWESSHVVQVGLVWLRDKRLRDVRIRSRTGFEVQILGSYGEGGMGGGMSTL